MGWLSDVGSSIGNALSSAGSAIGGAAKSAFGAVKSAYNSPVGQMVAKGVASYATGGWGGLAMTAFDGISSAMSGSGTSPSQSVQGNGFGGLSGVAGNFINNRFGGNGGSRGFSGGVPTGFYPGYNFSPAPVLSPAEQGQNTRTYLANAYPEMNPWERAGTGGTMFGSNMETQVLDQNNQARQAQNAIGLQQQSMAKDLLIAKMNMSTQLQMNRENNQTSLLNAGIQSQTSRANVTDQLGVQAQQVAINREQMQANVKQIAASTELTEQQKKVQIAQELQTYAQTHNINLSAGQIAATTQQILAQTVNTEMQRPGIEQDNANKKYATSWLGGPIKDASNIFDWLKSGWESADDTAKKSGGVSGATWGAGGKTNPYQSDVRFAYPQSH